MILYCVCEGVGVCRHRLLEKILKEKRENTLNITEKHWRRFSAPAAADRMVENILAKDTKHDNNVTHQMQNRDFSKIQDSGAA